MRYVPSRALPEQAFVPGGGAPRPPAGASTSDAEVHVAPEHWRSAGDYLFGVDLYNGAYFWEAHEAWEAAWRRCERHGVQAEFYAGLIAGTAAALKLRMHAPRGFARLAARAVAKLAHVGSSASRRYMGLDVLDFAHKFALFARAPAATIDARPRIELED